MLHLSQVEIVIYFVPVDAIESANDDDADIIFYDTKRYTFPNKIRWINVA